MIIIVRSNYSIFKEIPTLKVSFSVIVPARRKTNPVLISLMADQSESSILKFGLIFCLLTRKDTFKQETSFVEHRSFDLTYTWIISYSKGSNWCQISKLSSNFECVFMFCYLDWANSIKTDLHICNLWTGQFVSFKSVI